jgi:hypothetical protein
MHKLHQWVQEGRDGKDEEWYCIAYDHGPFCRNCVNLDGTTSLGVEEIAALLWEIDQRDEEIELLLGLVPGTCEIRLDHSGNRAHAESKTCKNWTSLRSTHA